MRFALLATGVLSASMAVTAQAQLSSSSTPTMTFKGAPAVKNLPAKQVGPTGPALTPVPLGTFLVGGSDNCTTADAITGVGSFSVDNTVATTGSPIGACGAMQNDVWFRWTAPSTGVAFISTCGTVAGDSVIAVWGDAGAGVCPSTQILCLDDFCGLQTQVSFGVTAGTAYMLELGGFNGATYSGSFSISISTPPANDSCATPTIISGSGPFNFDNGAASTGTEGQAEGACSFFGSSAINNDVWYRWTSTFTGTARVTTCGLTTVDTKISAFSGAGCPTGASLGCNDDACALQTRTDFPVVNGGVYTIQLGLYPFTTAGGTGQFTINQFIAPPNDSCATPTNVVGDGPHAFDTTASTTGTEGQAEPLCLAFGSSNLFNDSWFTWTATTTSLYELSLCGGTAFDSRVAVYQGSGCPTGAALACNDDSCGLVSALCFNATAGQIYTIQIGSYGATVSGTGTFQFTPQGPGAGPCAAIDDGTSDNSVGLTNGGAVAWLVGYGQIGQNFNITNVDTCFGTPLFPGGYIPSGNVTVAVWDDPNDDGDASDCVLVSSASAAVAPGSVDTDIFQSIAVPPALVSGIFFVGAVVTHAAGEFPAPLDQSSTAACGGGGAGGSWVVGNSTGTLDLSTLTNNDVPPQTIASAGLPGNWLVRTNCGPSTTGTPFCFGDGSIGTACPCGNTGAAGNGCANSVNPNGANLAASGLPSLSNDTVTLTASGMPATATGLFYQGTTAVDTVFGDGKRCAGGQVVRLGTKTAVGGVSAYPAPGDLSISVRAATFTPPQPISPGQTRRYQTWYRNAAAFCTVSTFNLTNGVQIVWGT